MLEKNVRGHLTRGEKNRWQNGKEGATSPNCTLGNKVKNFFRVLGEGESLQQNFITIIHVVPKIPPPFHYCPLKEHTVSNSPHYTATKWKKGAGGGTKHRFFKGTHCKKETFHFPIKAPHCCLQSATVFLRVKKLWVGV